MSGTLIALLRRCTGQHGMVRQSLEELMSDEPVDMRLESMGHLRLADEQADLNISLLGGFGEVGRTDEGGVAVDDHALGMQARSGTLALGQSTKTGTFLRVDRPLPAYADAMGVRAEIEVTRSGPLAAIDQVENPFAKFCLYQFPPHISQGRFGCFIPAIREKGVKRAMALLSTDKALAAEFQAVLDQCPAPWWDPATLWNRAKERTAAVFAEHHPGAAHALGQAA